MVTKLFLLTREVPTMFLNFNSNYILLALIKYNDYS